jgi:hypothetical protein
MNSINLCQNASKTYDNSFASSDMLRFPEEDQKRSVNFSLNEGTYTNYTKECEQQLLLSTKQFK